MPRALTRAAFKVFLLLDRFGLHVLPKHYYSPIPDYHWLRTHPEAWRKRASLTGIRWDLDRQFQWLAQICEPYYHEVAPLQVYRQVGAGFGYIGAQVLHCFTRAMAPPRIIEIGGGTSTACMVLARSLNQQEGRPFSEITCVEPYPTRALRSLKGITLIEQPWQAVPCSLFTQLQSGDLLFIDSSHSVKVGSDVLRIYLETIPGLPSGVFIHVHDIFLPYLYSRNAFSHPWGCSQETSLLLALLTNNEHLSILACLSALHYDRKEKLAGLLTDYRPQADFEGLYASDPPTGHFPNSIWLLTC